jgi:poly-gamma-glutamate synthesis protein (capsule biosynthesis protein)
MDFRKLLPVGIVILLFAAYGWYIRSPAARSAPDVLGDTELPSGVAQIQDSVTLFPASHLTLSSIFAADHSWVNALPPEKTVTMIATGDVIPARSVNSGMVTRNNFRWPFEKTADVLSAADITVINLETPLLSSCTPTIDGMVFCGDARAAEGLTYAGIDIATMGNNHAGNYSEAGVEETKQVLALAGIIPVSGNIVYKTVKGTIFAFLSYNDIGHEEPGVPWADEEKIARDIKEAEMHADVVVVAYHWGTEYVTQPNARQRELAHMAVDSGADVVLGNHPHWIEPVELYKDAFIIYAHGNFVFDQEWSEETKRGVVGKYVFYDNKLIDVQYLPVRIIDYGQPYFLEGAQRQALLDAMRESSVSMIK